MSHGLGVPSSPTAARARLIPLLQRAHAGELAAMHAYRGHAASLPPGSDRERVRLIEADEVRHRSCVRAMLDALGAGPDPARERRLLLIGRTIGMLCRVGGWFVPMFGAGRLERDNIVEYEEAARLALVAGHSELVDELLTMAEVEWDHERFFREVIEGHWLRRVFPRWPVPAARVEIRSTFARFRSEVEARAGVSAAASSSEGAASR